MLYNLFAVYELYYLLLKIQDTKERSEYIYERWMAYHMSALSWFIFSIPVAFLLSSWFHPFVFIFMLLFGLQLPLVMVITHTQRDKYWAYRREKMDADHKARREATEAHWRKIKEDFEEILRRQTDEAHRRQEDKWDNIRHEFRDARGNANPNTFKSKQQAPPPPPKTPRVVSIEGYLATLGLPGSCRDLVLIKKAYRTLMKKYHPDVNKASNAESKYKEVKKAFDILEKVLK